MSLALSVKFLHRFSFALLIETIVLRALCIFWFPTTFQRHLAPLFVHSDPASRVFRSLARPAFSNTQCDCSQRSFVQTLFSVLPPPTIIPPHCRGCGSSEPSGLCASLPQLSLLWPTPPRTPWVRPLQPHAHSSILLSLCTSRCKHTFISLITWLISVFPRRLYASWGQRQCLFLFTSIFAALTCFCTY